MKILIGILLPIVVISITLLSILSIIVVYENTTTYLGNGVVNGDEFWFWFANAIGFLAGIAGLAICVREIRRWLA